MSRPLNLKVFQPVAIHLPFSFRLTNSQDSHVFAMLQPVGEGDFSCCETRLILRKWSLICACVRSQQSQRLVRNYAYFMGHGQVDKFEVININHVYNARIDLLLLREKLRTAIPLHQRLRCLSPLPIKFVPVIRSLCFLQHADLKKRS